MNEKDEKSNIPDTSIPKLIPRIQIEKLLKDENHPEKPGMLNVYICTECNFRVSYVYLDAGVTPPIMRCASCGKMSATTCGATGTQPDAIWYRPKDINELKDIRDAAFKHDEQHYIDLAKKERTSIKEIKRLILTNYIKHYNQGGLFSRKRV
jgi:hypothetical protein